MTLHMILFCFELPSLFEIKAYTVRESHRLKALITLKNTGLWLWEMLSGDETAVCILFVHLRSQPMYIYGKITWKKDFVFDYND